MAAKVPIRTVFDGTTATGLAEFQSSEYIDLTYGGLGASLSIGTAGQVLKVNSGASALEFGNVEAVLNIDGMTDGTSATLAATDKFAVSDGGTEKYMLASQIDTYVSATTSTLTNKTLTTPTIAEIDSGSTITLDATTDIVLDADGGDVFFKDGGTTFGSATNTSGNLIIKSGTTTAATFSGANVTLAGTVASGAITSSGVVTGSGFTAGSAVIAESELELLDGLTAGTAIASKVVTTDSNIDTTGQRNLTITGELDAATLDISGDADIDGTLEADAITVDGTTLAEFIADTAGAMVSSNTETGVTVTYQDGDNTIDFAIDAAQTTITSIYATDLIMGEDSQTAIDFGTANEIDFKVDNAARLTLTSGALYPVTDNEIDLGTSSLEFKDAFFDGTVTSDAFAGPLTGDVTGTSSLVTVTDSTANTNFPVVFHNESDALLDDTGALRYNPSTGTLLVPNLSVAGTTTTVDTVTMEASNAIIFEGATADGNETTLSIVDPTADHTQYLINQGGYIPVLAAATTTAITSTPAELNLLDTAAANSVVNSKAVIYGSSGELAGVLSTGAQTGITSIYNTSLAIGYGSSHANINFGTDNQITFDIDGTGQIVLKDGQLHPVTDSDVDLGKSDRYYKDAYIDSITTTGAITSGGILKTDDATEATSTTDGSLQTDGGLSVVKDAVFGDDVKLLSDASVIAFGTNGDVTLTHVHDTGILLNSTMAIQFNDASQSINAPSNAILDINATDEIELNATAVDLNGTLTVSGDTTLEAGADLITASAGTSNFRAGVNAGINIASGGNYNVVVGDEAGNDLTTGDSNVLIGYGAGDGFDAESNNVGIGYNALGGASYAASNNVAIGKDAGLVITTGASNVLIGALAGDAITTGAGNNIVGLDAGGAITTGSFNTAMGYQALLTEDTASYNTAIGTYALKVSNGGDHNTAVGYNALVANTTAANNVAVGSNALAANTTGTNNVAVGTNAVDACTTGNHLVGIGWQALSAVTTGQFSIGIGKDAGLSVTTGDANTLIGYHSGDAITTGANNTALGAYTLGAVTTVSACTAVGYNAGAANTSGTSNVFVGAYTGDAVTTGAGNTFVGDASGGATTTGAHSTLVGFQSGDALTTGGGHVCLGSGAGGGMTTATNSICIGVNAGSNLVDNAANAMMIGYGAQASASDLGGHELVLGPGTGKGVNTAFVVAGGNVFKGDNGTAWAQTSDRRIKKDIQPNTKGLAEICQVEPKSFLYKTDEELHEIPEFEGCSEGLPQGERVTSAIAQEVQEVFPEAVTERNDYGMLTVNTDPIFWAMINSIRELSTKLDSALTRITELEE